MMDQNRTLLWIILGLAVVLILGLIGLALLVAARPAGTGDQDMINTAVAEAVAAEQTRAAEQVSPTSPPPTEAPQTLVPTRQPPTPVPPSPTAPPPTLTPLPTPTPVPGDPAEALGDPTWVDNFDSSSSWTLFDTDCFRSDIRDGRYWMDAKGEVRLFCWELTWPRISNFYLQTLVQPEGECPPGGAFGLFFRGPDTDSGYLFGLTCEDQYGMYVWDGKSGALLVQPSSSGAIRSGEANRIGVIAKGDRYTLYANGMQLTEIRDETFVDGTRIGYFIRSVEGEPYRVSYDDFAYWDLD